MAAPYLNDFMLNHFPQSQEQAALSRAFYQLICAKSEAKTIDPSEMLGAVLSLSPQKFSGRAQEDAHEFLGFFLDQMSQELNRVAEKPAYKALQVSPQLSLHLQAKLKF